MELLTQFEQGFADLEAAFNGPAVAIQTDDFGIQKIGVRGKNDDVFVGFVAVPDENQLHRNPVFLRFDQNRAKDAAETVETDVLCQVFQTLGFPVVPVFLLIIL